MENLGSEEMPPEWMWPLDDEIAGWFDAVQAKRDEKYGTSSSDEVVPLSQNEYALGRRG